jgi:hypothetical protein
MILSALLMTAQLASVPPGQPPARLRFVHMDRYAAVYVDDAATAPDLVRQTQLRTRSLHVPFDTEDAPYWSTQRHDCAGRQSQSLWHESAIAELHDGKTYTPGSLQDWDTDADKARAALGADACDVEGRSALVTPLPSPDDAINQAYDLPLEMRFQPALYARYGDLGETLDFLGLDHQGVGWFVEPRSDRQDGSGAVADVLAISGRLAASGERFVWFRLRFDCNGRMLTLKGHRYAEGPRPLEPVMLEATSISIASDSMLGRVQQYACTPDNPPEVQVVPGLDSAIAGIVAHVAAMDAQAPAT